MHIRHKFAYKLQIAQNKCIRFCLGLDNRSHIGVNQFKTINWLPVQNRYEQCVAVSAFKFCKGLGPAYMSDIYSLVVNPRSTRRSEYRIKHPFRATNMGQNGISYIGLTVWNKLPPDCKLENIPNKFKHKIKENIFENVQRANDDIYVYY